MRHLINATLLSIVMFLSGCGSDEYSECDSRDGSYECPYTYSEGSREVFLRDGLTYWDDYIDDACSLRVYDTVYTQSVELDRIVDDKREIIEDNNYFGSAYWEFIINEWDEYRLVVESSSEASATLVLECY
ncbi:hypothetical protein GJV85_08745 [Sulfurimonas aquatica]|uniref:Uncharacterized protein n=1 Tax=Sulfurimonas aquatica TaxID=2672570 RepID=A0A975B149_9BACT|nr:hypothetical protein [Sulfurimonas aquatica]QSZ42195.1 hypothetical protein GJV85_08745 [Sulfurimonas aquatica]